MHRFSLVALVFALLFVACGDDDEPRFVVLTSGAGGSGGTGGTGGSGGTANMCPDEPDCNPGQGARDIDGDGCGDECCWEVCEVDMVLFDDNEDGCAERCGDKPCAGPDDCSVSNCVTLGGTCDDPFAVCTIMGCMGLSGGCGCDGNMYADACEAAEAGVILDATGDACSP